MCAFQGLLTLEIGFFVLSVHVSYHVNDLQLIYYYSKT
jgi:hypothetical protein